MGAQVLWPEREPLYDLMMLRAAIGAAAFASEKQSDPIDPSLCEWPETYFGRPGFWFDVWPTSLDVKVLALDPSKGQDRREGDWQAYVLHGRDTAGIEYVEAVLLKVTVEAMIDAGIELVKRFSPHAFAIETNQFQQLLLAPFQQAASRDRCVLPLHEVNNMVNKEVRIRRLGPPLCQRQIRFKATSPGTAELVQQLRDFPHGAHDDGPDALEVARRVSIELYNGREEARQQHASGY